MGVRRCRGARLWAASANSGAGDAIQRRGLSQHVPNAQVSDISLEDYIAVKPKFAIYVPHTAGRYQKKRFRKALCPIVERWAAAAEAGGSAAGAAAGMHHAEGRPGPAVGHAHGNTGRGCRQGLWKSQTRSWATLCGAGSKANSRTAGHAAVQVRASAAN